MVLVWDILSVLLWVLAVYVCVYDWEDAKDEELRKAMRREQKRMLEKMWQRDGKTVSGMDNGSKLPRKSKETDFQERE